MMLKKEEHEWLNSFYEKFEEKLAKTSLEIGVKFPYTTREGKYEEFTRRGDIGTWTSGFWVGVMWKAYNASGKTQYLDIANECTKILSCILDNSERVTHDVGFLMLLSAVAGFKLTGNEEFKKFGIHGATYLAGRFNPITKNVIANNYSDNMVIIDTMMNIPLLFWAYELTGLSGYRDIAVSHADRTMQTHVRADGSVNHQVRFDGETGEITEVTRGQGYSENSSWSRGQAWALYGFTLVYLHTKDVRFLNTAKRVAHYFLANIDETGVPLIDFRAPAEPVLRDSTAGAIAACGLIELSKCVGEFEEALYLNGALKLLKGLYECCNFDEDEQSILQMGSEGYHAKRGDVFYVGKVRVVADGPHIPIIYGDYFLLEALAKFKQNDMLFW